MRAYALVNDGHPSVFVRFQLRIGWDEFDHFDSLRFQVGFDFIELIDRCICANEDCFKRVILELLMDLVCGCPQTGDLIFAGVREIFTAHVDAEVRATTVRGSIVLKLLEQVEVKT